MLSVNLVDHQCAPARLEHFVEFLAQHAYHHSSKPDYILHCHPSHVTLEDAQHPQRLSISADFLSGKINWRRQQAEKLHRAVGINDQQKPSIIDATAGLGRDAFIMADRGANITLLERHPLVFLLLEDSITQALHSGEAAANRMAAVHTDALSYLASDQTAAQVIFLDPMFPASKKTAKNKKEMQLLQNLLESDGNDEKLLHEARENAINRVVVKRPIKAKDFAGTAPDFAIAGKNIRYDVYVNRAF